MKNTKELALSLSDYKSALPMYELLQVLGLEGPNGSGKIFCPLHDESTPSCHVYDSHLHCYGCGKSMDSIDLIMELEGVGFKDAVRRLAQLTGLPAPDFNGDMESIHRKQAEIAAIYARFFEKSKEKSVRALDYLQSRGIGPDTIGDLEFGYFSVAHELDDEERELAQKAGLLAKSGNFHFAGAVVFPITYGHRVMSLYGRMADDGLAPRHVFPSKTDPPMPLTIYGLDDCRKEGEIYVVEGIIDAITLKSHGINNAVAVFGTQGLTEERLNLLKKSNIRQVNLAFDNDNNGSGHKAVLKSGPKLIEAGLSVKVVTFPRPATLEKIDVNSYFRDHCRDDFLALPCTDFIEFFTDTIPIIADPQAQYRALQPLLETISLQLFCPETRKFSAAFASFWLESRKILSRTWGSVSSIS
ncbi:MAG: toprim domain-containing protein [Desulfomonilaceae bacterium]